MSSTFLLGMVLGRFTRPQYQHNYVKHTSHSASHLCLAVTFPCAMASVDARALGMGQVMWLWQNGGQCPPGATQQAGDRVHLNQAWWIFKIPFSLMQTNLEKKNIL